MPRCFTFPLLRRVPQQCLCQPDRRAPGRFPVVARLVGEEFLRAMARAYIEREPPRSAVLIRYGVSCKTSLRGFRTGGVSALSRRHGLARMGVACGLSCA